MIRVISSLLCAALSFATAAQSAPTAAAGKRSGNNKHAYAVETKTSETPLRIEQDCPSPEMADVIHGSSWNTVELGISFPLGEGLSEARPYSRYTCPAPSPAHLK